MNYVFDSNKNMNEYSGLIESEYKLEYLNIEDEALEPHENALNQFNDFKALSYDLPDVYDDQILGSKTIIQKEPDEDNMLFCSNLKSTCLLNNSS